MGHAAVMAGTTIDRFRFTIEQMPPAEYLSSRYYERWLWAIERMAAEQRLLDGGERPPATDWPRPPLPTGSSRFQPGARVRVRNAATTEHTRVPRYLRHHLGTIQLIGTGWPLSP